MKKLLKRFFGWKRLGAEPRDRSIPAHAIALAYIEAQRQLEEALDKSVSVVEGRSAVAGARREAVLVKGIGEYEHQRMKRALPADAGKDKELKLGTIKRSRKDRLARRNGGKEEATEKRATRPRAKVSHL